MATLNIIGNGFDLYHGLPTSYYDFACYMLTTDEGLYTELSEMYDFPVRLVDGHTNVGGCRVAQKNFWSKFEENLGDLSPEWVEHTLLDDLGLETPEAVTLDAPNRDRTNDLKRKLNEWISAIDTTDNFQYIISRTNGYALPFSNEDSFVSFNYTHTLENVYHTEAENVLHIHGTSSVLNNYNDLIIGHGNEDAINRLSKQIEQLRNEPYGEFYQATRNRIVEFSFEKAILNKLKKPIDLGLMRLNNFLGTIDTPDCICTYGFSFGEVDDPYIQYICDKFPTAKWRFSYYGDQDRCAISRITRLLDLPLTQFEDFHFCNPTSASIKNEIAHRNNIVYYEDFDSPSGATPWYCRSR